MANIDAPKGLVPVKHLDGSPFNGQVNMYLLPASDSTVVFVGSPVKSGGSAGAAGTVVNGINVEGMPTVTLATPGDTLRGVVVGFLPNQTDLSQKHRPASQARIALVADAPDIIFEIQEVSGGTALTADAVGLNADLTAEVGNTATGVSTVELDNATEVNTSAQVRILGLVKRPDNAYGEHAKWLVLINEHELKSTAGV